MPIEFIPRRPVPGNAPGAADNGLSVDPNTFHIVLGNDLGGTSAVLLSNREIPCDIFLITFTATEGHVIIRPVAGGAINQFDAINNRNNDSVPGTFTVQDGNLMQQVSLQATTPENTLVMDSDSGNSTGINKISFQTGAIEQFSIRAGSAITSVSGFTIEKTIALAGIKIFPSGRVFIGVTTPNPTDSGAAAQLQIGGALITAAGAPLTAAPLAIRFGGVVVAAAVLDGTQYIEVVHGGVLRKLALIV